MKHLITALSIVFIMIVSTQITLAQADEAWEIEQRCLPEPTTTLPDDWSFDGMLILTSSNKLHAYRQEWETPHILLFDTGWNIPHSGQLSSDGKWFAIIKGNRETVQVVTLWTTDEIQVIDTNSGDTYIVDWDTGYTATHRLYGRFLNWLPDNQLLYSKTEPNESRSDHEEWYVIDPITGDFNNWDSILDLNQNRLYLSPDGQKAVYDNYSGFFLHNGTEEMELSILLATWHPDSTKFATFIVDERFVASQFVIYNLGGEIEETVLNLSTNEKSALLKNAWSPDGRYVIFEADKIYIADTETEILIDPCIEARSMTVAWSQDSSQLAFVDEFERQRRIQIIDFDLWERFVVGYHSGQVIGWRADDE